MTVFGVFQQTSPDLRCDGWASERLKVCNCAAAEGAHFKTVRSTFPRAELYNAIVDVWWNFAIDAQLQHQNLPILLHI